MQIANSSIVVSKNKQWLPKTMAACTSAGAAASVIFWCLQLSTPLASPVIGARISLASSLQDGGQFVARALGHATPTVVQENQTGSQFKLLGVISSASGQGSALIAADGQWPKAYRVGQTLQEGLTLESVSVSEAVLKSSSRQMSLNLPDIAKP
jgi:general secretion pathway protein C